MRAGRHTLECQEKTRGEEWSGGSMIAVLQIGVVSMLPADLQLLCRYFFFYVRTPLM